jgi:hypothetical protein
MLSKGFFDGPFRALIKVAPRFGWCQAVSRSQQQSGAEPVLEVRDRLGNGRLADAELLRRLGKRAGFDHADGCLHRGKTVHAYSLWKYKISRREGSAGRSDQECITCPASLASVPLCVVEGAARYVPS